MVKFPKILMGPEGEAGDVACTPRKSKENGISALLENPQELSGQGSKMRRCHQEIAALSASLSTSVTNPVGLLPQLHPRAGGLMSQAGQCASIAGEPRAEGQSGTSARPSLARL